jgi:pimeloyl-ACP methyl ester carboxylesterase
MASVLYLHGFASGPLSTKGQYLQRQFGKAGIAVHQPDLAEGDFPRLTVTRQLETARKAAAQLRPSLVIGSSLGGYVAALLAAGRPRLVPAVVLLAPAFNFARRWAERLGEPQMAAWKECGACEVYHYGEKRDLPLRYGFYEDALEHPPFPTFSQPCLMLHGRRDDVVDATQSIDYAQGKSNIRLEILESDHALTDVLDEIWVRVCEFHGKSEPAAPQDA